MQTPAVRDDIKTLSCLLRYYCKLAVYDAYAQVPLRACCPKDDTDLVDAETMAQVLAFQP
jgi:hypothetical protein